MNKWNDIVLTLRELKDIGVDESVYQKRIEEQFKFYRRQMKAIPNL